MVYLVLVVEEKHNIECPTLMFWVFVNVSQACGSYEYIWVVVLIFFQVFGRSLPYGRLVAIFVSSEGVQERSSSGLNWILTVYCLRKLYIKCPFSHICMW
jgi:hypothetical protein